MLEFTELLRATHSFCMPRYLILWICCHGSDWNNELNYLDGSLNTFGDVFVSWFSKSGSLDDVERFKYFSIAWQEYFATPWLKWMIWSLVTALKAGVLSLSHDCTSTYMIKKNNGVWKTENHSAVTTTLFNLIKNTIKVKKKKKPHLIAYQKQQ